MSEFRACICKLELSKQITEVKYKNYYFTEVWLVKDVDHNCIIPTSLSLDSDKKSKMFDNFHLHSGVSSLFTRFISKILNALYWILYTSLSKKAHKMF